MECLKNQKVLVELDLSYLDDFIAMHNESRRSWKVYYPPLNRQILIETMSAIPEKCVYAVKENDIILGYLLCHINDHYSNNAIRTAHHETVLVSRERCKSGYKVYKVTEMLIDAMIAWAKSKQASRIIWASGTGSWRGFEHILLCRNARQIGVVLDLEL